MVGPREAVEDLGLGRGDRQLAVLVLAVEGEQPPAEQLQVRRRGGAAADERRGPARGRHPPPEHDLLDAGRQALGELAHLRLIEQARRNVEAALDPGLVGSRADDLRARPAAHQEIERVGEDGLSGPRLTGDRVEAGAEPELGPLDQQQVLDSQLSEHALCVAPAAAGSRR